MKITLAAVLAAGVVWAFGFETSLRRWEDFLSNLSSNPRYLVDEIIVRQVLKTTHGGVQASRPPGPTPEVTPTKDFYVVSKNFVDPEPDVSAWKLEISGLVDRPLTLTFADLVKLPTITRYQTLECISNPIGGELISTAVWTGVRMKDLLDRAAPKANSYDVVLTSVDGYQDSFPIAKASFSPITMPWFLMHAARPDAPDARHTFAAPTGLAAC